MSAPCSIPEIDSAVADGAIARWSDDDVRHAADVYAGARFEAERWQRICERWTRVHGIRVWRGGHPSDRDKLRQRRVWRYRARVCFEHFTLVLSEWRPSDVRGN